MVEQVAANFWYVMDRGGLLMWPLGLLAIVAVMLIVERSWFWIRMNHPARLTRLNQISMLLRQRELAAAGDLVRNDRSVYGQATIRLIRRPVNPADVADAVQTQRARMERFMPTLSTIITAAPLLGILGTVTGLIRSFHILSADNAVVHPRAVSPAIAEALLTTAVGLAVSLVVLFPYNAFRAQVDRTLNRFEVLIAAVGQSDGR